MVQQSRSQGLGSEGSGFESQDSEYLVGEPPPAPPPLKMLYGSGAKWLNFSEDLNAYLTRYTVKETQTGVQSLARRLYSVFSKWRDDDLKRICS